MRSDEWLHRRFGNFVRLVFALVPRRLQKHPQACAGWDRAIGRVLADAPLVQTPVRNLPPQRVGGVANLVTGLNPTSVR